MTAIAPPATRAKKPRREPELTFLRLVPGTSVVHRLWAGTKLLVVAIIAIVTFVSPNWPVLAGTVLYFFVAIVFARIPLGAFPRLPRAFWALLAIGAFLSLWSATEPIVHVGAIGFSVGGLGQWTLLTLLAAVLIVFGALIGWTTPLGEVAPALSTLARPLRWLRLPVDEWVMATALAIRCLPLMIDEIRSLAAARRLRAHDAEGRPRAAQRSLLLEAHDLMATAIVVAIRRARDLGDAMTARGGITGGVSASRSRFGVADVVVLAGTLALGVGALVVLGV